jgi:hypothetical protein
MSKLTAIFIFQTHSYSHTYSTDSLQVEILALDPRKNPSTGKCYGANSQGTPGYPGTVPNTQGTNFTDTAIIIYEVVSDESGDWGYPVYQVKVATICFIRVALELREFI